MSGRRAVKRGSQRLPLGSHRAIYDGQTLLSSVLQNGQDFTALDRLGRPLSTHTSFIEAAEAVTQAATRGGASP
jgi:hypothetical protein